MSDQTPTLTDDQKAAARLFELSDEEYIAWGAQRPDVEALAPDPERERLKQAIRDALDERDDLTEAG